MKPEMAGAPERKLVAGSGGLLATKLHLPRPPPEFVPRGRLVERLDAGLARAMTLVCAPAGFGKTALLAQWCQRRQLPVAWLSLDVDDNDPARFWRHAVAALDRLRPGIAQQLGPLLGPPAPTSFEGFVAALVNEFADGGGDGVLVLDDYHVLDALPVHASVRFLLAHMPPGLHLVLTSRADPPLPVARLRTRGQLAELRAADLRFTAGEAAVLLREAVGSELPDDAVAALQARTEGWAAGLQLAALSLRGEPDIGGFVARFSGSHRYVLDYLTEEVLEVQPAAVREFLLETSVLDRLSGPLCDAVTGRGDGQSMLEAVEAANLFLVPLDEVRGWWRYHHLFGDLLRARVCQQRPERVRELHRNAAVWYDAHGWADAAVRHAMDAGELSWAAGLVERYADELIIRAEGATVQRWLAALPGELLGSRPRLLLVRARTALQRGELERAQSLLDAAEHALATGADEPYEPSTDPGGSRLANVPAAIVIDRAWLAGQRGDAEAAIGFASQARGLLGDGESLLAALVRWHLAVGEWLRGQLPAAQRAFAASAAELSNAADLTLAVWSYQYLGQVQRALGRLDAALVTYRRAIDLTTPSGRPALPAAGLGYVGLAQVEYERGELDAARRHVTEGIRLGRQLAYTQPLATGLATLAWVRQAAGDPAGARAAMDDAGRAAPGPVVTGLLNPVPALRVRLLLAQGDLATAADWTAERGLGVDDEPRHPDETTYLALARVLLAQGQPAPALRLLDRLYAAASGQARTGNVIEIQALRALALGAGGDEPGAVAALAEALTLGHPQSHLRVFADEGPPMGALLGRLIATRRADGAATDGIPMGYVGRLVRLLEEDVLRPGSDGTPSAPPVTGLVTGLSDRELDVLRLMAAGKQNQEIARELYVALDTVKKHVTHILGKLGATNRTEATARARALGLLP